MRFDCLPEAYDYSLPKNLIAQKPSSPRDSARLLAFDQKSGAVRFDTFKNLGKYLPKDAVLVFNRTRVIPARLKLLKETGGKVEILYLGGGPKQNLIRVLANKKLAPGSKLFLPRLSNQSGRPTGRLRKEKMFEAIKKDGTGYLLRLYGSRAVLKKILQAHGQTPLPPYIKNSPLNEKQRREQYQSVFAKTGESVAAPTASLHFTKNLLGKLRKKGIEIKFLNLNVNLGTFAPLNKTSIKTGKLHLENYNIDKKTVLAIAKAKQQGRKIIAVGTTAVRALETAFQKPKQVKDAGETDIFIRPPYKFKITDGIITNFHVPKSSLMMLVASMVGRKTLLGLYSKAINKRFRFFSFGDGMLII